MRLNGRAKPCPIDRFSIGRRLGKPACPIELGALRENPIGQRCPNGIFLSGRQLGNWALGSASLELQPTPICGAVTQMVRGLG
jgi:hypothetical protein